MSLDNKKNTAVLKQLLKNEFNLNKVAIRTRGSVLYVTYTGGIAERRLLAYLNNLKDGSYNANYEYYEYSPSHLKGLVYEGFELNTFQYVFVEQKFNKDVELQMIRAAAKYYNISYTEGENIHLYRQDIITELNGQCNSLHCLAYYDVQISFVTQDLDKIQILDFGYDQELDSQFYSYTVQGIENKIFKTNSWEHLKPQNKKGMKRPKIKLPFKLIEGLDNVKVVGNIPSELLEAFEAYNPIKLDNEKAVFHTCYKDDISNIILNYAATGEAE